MKKLVAGAAVLSLGAFGLVACGGHETQEQKCKSAASGVYNDILKAKTWGDVMALSAKYGDDESSNSDTRLRDILPECKPLTNAQDDKIEKELKPLYDKAGAHATKLFYDGISGAFSTDGN